MSGNVVDGDVDGYHVCDDLDFSGSKLDVCPLELECVLTVAWNGDEAVEVVVTGRQVETLRLESLVEVVSYLDEDS